jgi:hypothetical protein
MAVDRPTCTEVPAAPTPLRVQLPGGITLESMPLSNIITTTELNYVQAMMAQLSPALAALQPIFILVDTVIALKDTVQSIPGLIVGDVDTFLEALNRVVSGVAKLTGMTPAFAVPVLIRDMVAFLIAVLDVIDAQLNTILQVEAEAAALIDQAATAPEAYQADLLATGQCKEELAATMLEHAVAAMGPVQNLLLIMDLLIDLVQGIPGMPEIGDLSGTTEEVKETLAALREALELLPV